MNRINNCGQKPSFNYVCILNAGLSPGVVRKIGSIIDSAANLGYKSEKCIFSPSIGGLVKFVLCILSSKSNVLFVRYYDWAAPFFFLVFLYQRLKGHFIIVEVPTPLSVALRELDSTKFTRLLLLRKAIIRIFGGWTLFPANKVVQYSKESAWFKFGLKEKIITLGNGISIDDSTPIIKRAANTDSLNLIAVAQLAVWHGYDRIIRAVSDINNSTNNRSVYLTIVGEGAALASLQALAKKVGSAHIRFTGNLSGNDLNKVFEGMHLGVSSLGLFRVGLNESSDLKTREYLARGLCVIGAGVDPDFSDYSKYRFVVSNEDEIQSIKDLLLTLDIGMIPQPNEVREFALNHLSMEKKLQRLLELS